METTRWLTKLRQSPLGSPTTCRIWKCASNSSLPSQFVLPRNAPEEGGEPSPSSARGSRSPKNAWSKGCTGLTHSVLNPLRIAVGGTRTSRTAMDRLVSLKATRPLIRYGGPSTPCGLATWADRFTVPRLVLQTTARGLQLAHRVRGERDHMGHDAAIDDDQVR